MDNNYEMQSNNVDEYTTIETIIRSEINIPWYQVHRKRSRGYANFNSTQDDVNKCY